MSPIPSHLETFFTLGIVCYAILTETQSVNRVDGDLIFENIMNNEKS